MSRPAHRDPVDLVGIGVAVRDITVRLDPFPDHDAKVAARSFVESGGGPVPTALVTLSRLGGGAAWAGPLGDDPAGSFILEGLRREGVDTAGAVQRAGAASPASVILVEAGGSRRVCEWRQAGLSFGVPDLQRIDPALSSCRALLLDGRLPEAQIEAASRARRSGALVALDCGHPRPGVEEILALCDVAILSHSYPRALHGECYPQEEFVRDLAGRMPGSGRRIAGLTLGGEGALLAVGGGEPVRVPGIALGAAEVLDTTGAGDVFHGAFIFELLRGRPAAGACRFANAAAALKCRGLTGRAPLPPAGEIRRVAGAGRL